MKYELLLLKNFKKEDKKMKYENITLQECLIYNKIANMIFECDADKKEVKFKRED